jgi:hypothetical protein
MEEHAVWKAEPLAAPWPGWKIVVNDGLFILEVPHSSHSSLGEDEDWIAHGGSSWIGSWFESTMSDCCEGDSLDEALVAFQSYPNAEVAKMVDATFRDVATLWSISQNTGKEFR